MSVALAVGAVHDSGEAIGINGDQTFSSSTFYGGAYTFIRKGTEWSEQAYIKSADREQLLRWFGHSVSLSADGNSLAVGASSRTVHIY